MRCSCGSLETTIGQDQTWASWLALRDDVAVRQRGYVVTYACGCGQSWIDHIAEMYDNEGVTSELADRIYWASLHAPFTEVARTIGVHKDLVRDVFKTKSLELLRNPTRPLDVVVLRRQDAWNRTFVLACDGSTPEIVDAFDGFGDTRLSAFLADHEGRRIHTEWDSAAHLLNKNVDSVSITLHRMSVIEWIRQKTPKCISVLRAMLGRNDRKVLRSIEAIVAKSKLDITIREAEILEIAKKESATLRRFLWLSDALIDIFITSDTAVAESDFMKWVSGLETKFRAIFEPIHRGIEKFRRLIFNVGYAVIPNRTWSQLMTKRLEVMAQEPAMKTVVRHLASIHSRTDGVEMGRQYR